ncbi:Serine protease, partial [Rhyzopertha dominica]
GTLTIATVKMKRAIFFVVSLVLVAADEAPFETLQNYYLKQSPAVQRIIDGEPAAHGQFPWQVAVRFTTSSGTFFCGGSLIDRQWVLTAAHCTTGALSFELLLGGVTISGSEEGRITINYSSSTVNNDIALIRLPDPILYTSKWSTNAKFLANIRPVSLPVIGVIMPARLSATVSGWGRISDNTTGVSNTLNYVNLTTILNSECATVYGDSVGDSGGALVTTTASGNIIQVGVVSFVHTAGCGSGNPSGYVRTESFLSWIHLHTGIAIA